MSGRILGSAADGNAVSRDTLVGPPDRVRWIAAATSEVEGMVTAGGRNFYGGILARDSFNGLRLWHRDLRKNGRNNADAFSLPRLPGDGARPIASHRLLFAVLQNRPVALDAATGEVVLEFGDMVNPTAVMHDGRRVIAADDDSVRAFSVEDGQEIWKVPALGPQNIIGDGSIVTFIQGRVRRGEKAEAMALDAETGAEKMATRRLFVAGFHDSYSAVKRAAGVRSIHAERPTTPATALHVVSAATGEHRWSKEYPPGMNHKRQARAMFVDDDLWILHGGKINTSDKRN